MNYYIHVPFCASKCGYCVFYSETSGDTELWDRYLDKLSGQLAETDEFADTVYIGGGTPTIFDVRRLERLLETVCASLKHGHNTEISIEANPETLTGEKIAVLRRYVSRLSTGVQSFFPEVRDVLGRKCSQKQLESSLDLVACADFPHWNCDLIYAVPGRSVHDWNREFDVLEKYPVDHVSCYNLTPEEGARLFDELIPETDIVSELETVTVYRLKEAGIRQYEVSNYAVPGGECRHNINVWRGGLLRGFGPSAAGFDGADRMIEVSSLEAWLNGAAPEIDHISHLARLSEIFAVNLRTVAGWDRRMWSLVPGADDWQERLIAAGRSQALHPGWFELSADTIKLTPEGLAFWDTIAEELLA